MRTFAFPHLGGAMRGLAAIVALPVLAGCAGPSVDYSLLDSAYSPSEIAYAGDGRDFAVTARGALPDGTAGEALAAAIVRAMDDQPGWFHPHYTARPGKSARPDFRVSWLVGVPAATSVKALCDSAVAIPKAGEGRFVFAAVCRGKQYLSYAGGALGDVASAGDPRFARLVVAATREIMPNRAPTLGGRSRELPCLAPGPRGC